MIPEYFVYVGAVISFIGGISYLIDTVKGKVKPNRVTWLLWSIVPLIAFSAEISEGVGLLALMTFMIGFKPLLIFLASFVNKKSVWKLSKLDIFCGVFSLLGIILWYITQEGLIAIVFSLIADFMAAIPTLVKSWLAPETEDHKAFTADAIGIFVTLLTIKTWNFAHYGFPLYIFTIDIILAATIKFQLGKKFIKPAVIT